MEEMKKLEENKNKLWVVKGVNYDADFGKMYTNRVANRGKMYTFW